MQPIEVQKKKRTHETVHQSVHLALIAMYLDVDSHDKFLVHCIYKFANVD